MAIFQPTNIIPSSLIGQGTVDVNDNMEISWQVNGNSAMTAFQIDFYRKSPVSIYESFISTYSEIPNGGFYGIDRFGNPQFFTWNANEPWNVYDGKFANGNEYKFKITQYWKQQGEIYFVSDSQTNIGGSRFFYVPNVGYISFSYRISDGKSRLFIYNITRKKLWVKTGDNSAPLLELTNFSVNNSEPSSGINMGTAEDYGYDFTIQNSFNAFVTRTTPSLQIYQTDENFQNPIALTNTLATSIGYFQAQYTQEQNNAIRWIRWQIAQANNGMVGEILADTGDIYTPTLEFEFNGFFDGQQYAIRCFGESESGQSCDSDWQYFTITIENPGQYSGNFTAKCLNKENATLLEWEDVEVISGIYAPPVNNSGEAVSYENGAIILPANSSATWQNTGAGNTETNIAFASPWTAVCSFQPNVTGKTSTISLSGSASTPTTPPIAAQQKTFSGSTAVSTYTNKRTVSEYATIQESDGTYTATGTVNMGNDWEKFTNVVANWTNNPDLPLTPEISLNLDGKSYEFNITGGKEFQLLSGNVTEYIQANKTTLTQEFDGVIDSYIVNNTSPGVVHYEISTNGNTMTVTLWSNPDASPQAVSIQITASMESAYTTTISQNVDSNVVNYKVISVSNNVVDYSVSLSNNTITAEIVANQSDAEVYLGIELLSNVSQGLFFSCQSNNVKINRTANDIVVKVAGNTDYTYAIPYGKDTQCTVIVNTQQVIVYFYSGNAILNQYVNPISLSAWQKTISGVNIYGATSGMYYNNVTIYNDAESSIAIPSIYVNNPDFEPVWNNEQYSLYMTANFNGNLEGGTGTASGNGFRIYRQEIGTTILTPIATVPSTTTSLKDYGIVSRKAYQYSLYAYDINGAFMSAVEAKNTIATSFKNYSLLVCDYDQVNDEYHVRKQYLFALNLADGSVGNNNSPTMNANFTPYPTRMPSAQKYASGTLSGLIGTIYTVPALIEQIGQYKYTAKPSTMDYFDSVDLEQELYNLSVAPYQLFLCDMKGRLRMIATSGPITMTTNLKQKQQSISISLPWVEVGDASDVTIIQTPNDYGWNNDNQVLDVELDVDVATGELFAQYPFPYNGTKFYLTGVNKEKLTAKTPLGVTPAQFNLSDTAENTKDGELTATVIVNSEDNQ
ncbi:MAG: hypothetical protein J1E81_06255 [Eubacterium sp.]|nr:hypothetical protein [Eubacterium sp.]